MGQGRESLKNLRDGIWVAEPVRQSRVCSERNFHDADVCHPGVARAPLGRGARADRFRLAAHDATRGGNRLALPCAYASTV